MKNISRWPQTMTTDDDADQRRLGAGSKVIECPSCNKPVAWVTENAFRPFCSERCRILDLGEWASGNRYIPDDEEHSDVMSGQVNPEE